MDFRILLFKHLFLNAECFFLLLNKTSFLLSDINWKCTVEHNLNLNFQSTENLCLLLPFFELLSPRLWIMNMVIWKRPGTLKLSNDESCYIFWEKNYVVPVWDFGLTGPNLIKALTFFFLLHALLFTHFGSTQPGSQIFMGIPIFS